MALSISALPDDAQLAILARVPYADLRIGVAATCKTWSQFVTSTSLRATRTAAGWLESAVFAAGVSPRTPPTQTFLLTASGALQNAQLPQTAPIGPENPFDMSAAIALRHEVVIFDTPQDDATSVRVFALDPRKNSWRELAPFLRPGGVGGATIVASGFAGGRIFVVGTGPVDASTGPNSRRVDMYDPTRDEWSQLADMPTNESWRTSVEVAGKLYFLFPMRSADTKSTMIFDPATQTWAPGPQLPFDKTQHCEMVAFERQGRLCVLSSWELGGGSSAKAILAYDPATDDWSLLCGGGCLSGRGPISFPTLGPFERSTQVDGTIYVWGAATVNPLTYAVIMLRPGSTSWITVPLPAGLLEESNLPWATKIVGVRV